MYSRRELIASLRDIQKTYQDGPQRIEVLRNLSLDIYKGEFISVMGKSGSGKSTLLNILCLLDPEFSGYYQLGGKDITRERMGERHKLRMANFAYVPQKANLISAYNSIENTALPLFYQGVSRKERISRAKHELERVGLANQFRRRPSQLSGGQQQRVSIARALASNAKIIVADEPTGNLDKETALGIMELFKKLHDSGTTIVLVTHDSVWRRYCTRSLILEDGVLHETR